MLRKTNNISSIDFSNCVISLFNSSSFDVLCVLIVLILVSNLADLSPLSFNSLALLYKSAILRLIPFIELSILSLEDLRFDISVLITAVLLLSAMPFSVRLFNIEFFNLVISLRNYSVSMNFLLACNYITV